MFRGVLDYTLYMSFHYELLFAEEIVQNVRSRRRMVKGPRHVLRIDLIRSRYTHASIPYEFTYELYMFARIHHHASRIHSAIKRKRCSESARVDIMSCIWPRPRVYTIT